MTVVFRAFAESLGAGIKSMVLFTVVRCYSSPGVLPPFIAINTMKDSDQVLGTVKDTIKMPLWQIDLFDFV